jgi:uncharacterized protein (TIGR02594 family)
MFNLKIVALAAIATLFLAIPSEAATTKTRTHTCNNIICLFKQKISPKTTKKKTHTVKKKKTYYAKKKAPQVQTQKRKVTSIKKSSVYSHAANFVGLSEKRNTSTLQKLTGVNPRKTPWCAAFINSILKNSGHKTSGSNLASSFKNYGVPVRNPSQGDIVVLRRHVGIFVGYVNRNGRRYVAVLGGNQSNRVQVSYYPASKVVAYRRPS